MNNSIIHNKRGISLVFLAICLVAILGIATLAIDIGALRLGKQRSQNVADASALGGVHLLTGLAGSDTPALAEAQTLATANNWEMTSVDGKSTFVAEVLPPGTVVTLGDGTAVTVALNQAIKVTCRRNVNFAFAPAMWALLGETHADHGAPSASATAMWTGVQTTNYPLVPWVVPSNVIFGGSSPAVGQEFTLKVVNNQTAFTGSGNFQCVSYDGDSGGADYRKRVGGQTQTGVPIDIGDVLRPENGNMIGPTDQGLTNRLAGDTLYPPTTYNIPEYVGPCPYEVWEQAGSSTGVYPTNTTRIVVVPVAQSPLPQNGDIVVAGFAAFFICEAPGNGDVVGHFITARDDNGQLIFGSTNLVGTGSTTLITEARLVN